MNQDLKIKEKYYPLKISDIPEKGIDKWFENFKPPLPGSDFVQIYNEIFDAYAECVNSCEKNSNIYWATVINYKMVFLISNLFFKYISYIQLKNDGYTHIQGEGKIDDIIYEIKNKKLLCIGLQKNTLSLIFKEKLRELKQEIVANGLLKTIFSKKDCSIIGDINDPALNNYIKTHKFNPTFLRPFSLLPIIKKIISPKEKHEIEKMVDLFVKPLINRNKNYSEFLDNSFKNALKTLLSSTILDFTHIKQKLASKNLHQLLIGSVHNYYTRILSSAWFANGGETIVFTHGNSYLCGINGQPINLGSLLLASKYIVPSEGEKLQIETSRKHNPSKIVSNCDIIIQNNSYIKNIYEESKNQKKINKIQKVLIVGFPMDYWCYNLLSDHTSLNYSHLTINICKHLKEAGYEVIYKAHPDTIKETTNFFDNYVDKIIEKNFNNVYQQADCILYMSPFTTTFGVGVASNLPVVYVNNLNWDLWHKDIKEVLNKRAASIDVKSDKDGVIILKKENLLNALDNSLNLQDYSVVEQFAF